MNRGIRKGRLIWYKLRNSKSIFTECDLEENCETDCLQSLKCEGIELNTLGNLYLF